MRKVLTGTVSGGNYGSINVHVGALDEQEKTFFKGAMVEVRRADTPDSLLKELFGELDQIIDRSVMSASRNQRIKDIRERASGKGLLK